MTSVWFRHVEHLLPPFCDGELTAGEQTRVEAHLAACARCRRALEDIRFSARLVRGLTRVAAPPELWSRIEAAAGAPEPAAAPVSLALRWAAACLAVTALGVGAYWFTARETTGPWEVRAAGSESPERMGTGQWVETSAEERARIVVGSFGTVDVEPDTRVQLGAVSGSEYRMALAHGTISAEISAPPRLFVVDTPASTLVDLGCAYTVTVDAQGVGELRMSSGWAALEYGGRTSLVPAGAMCRTRVGSGPGTPYFEDADAALKHAVDDFDAGREPAAALAVILEEARRRDTLTLWHLLSRVAADDRARVYDAIARFGPPPASAPRERVIALDEDALREWREELAWTW